MSKKEFTLEELSKVAFQIITYSGEAKSEAMSAIYLAKENKFQEAEEKLAFANKQINIASEQHFELIQEEAKGNKVSPSLLLMHAEDQLLSTQALLLMAEEIIALYKKIK
ncbi:MAG: PTS lactose/cellobiose transporter subunit IIA [Mycoplasma sp.]|nr:PTS lactose/cellobiose transporter subunit IIA [Mycoplasma sp.]